jgi:hypothetical protein
MSISGSIITISSPNTDEDIYRQDTFDILIDLQDASGSNKISIRVGYREFVTTSHLTPDHDVDSCRDSVYPFVFGKGVVNTLFKTF